MDVNYLINLVAAMLILDAALTVTVVLAIAVVLVIIAVRLVIIVRLVFVAVRLVFVTVIRPGPVVWLHSLRARQRLGSAAESVTKRV